MGEFIISEKAKTDLIQIGNYSAKFWSEEQAESYVRMILNECLEIANKPMIGRSYSEYRPGLKGHTCGKHVIFYRIITNTKIRIIRILHERMDFPRHI